MKHISHRKHARRKYKRLMAALAGAAVVTSAMLPGIPIARVQAAENTVVAAPATVAEVPAAAAPATEPTAVETPSVAQVAEPAAKSAAETPAAEPAAPAQPATEQTRNQQQSSQTDRNQADRNQENRNQDRQQDRHNDEQHNAAGSPVAAVKAAAAVYGFDARNDNFSLQSQSSNEAVVLVRTDSGKTFKVHLSQDHGNWRVDSVKEAITGGGGGGVIRAGDPVDVVKDNAAIFGFDAAKDRFTLLSVDGGTAVVQVKTSGQTFKVDLERNGGKWVITTIRGIGNERYPATYRPASMYGYPTLGIATGPVATEKTLYSNDSFVNWTWQESAYPADMKLGVLVSPPAAATRTSIPGVIVDKVDSIDFGRQLVLYAHIGSVADRGYGIGIEKVAQTGNDLTVTVRIKSPLANNDWSLTKTNDVIPIDRLALNFTYPIHINFVDQDGVSLSSYTLQTK